MGVVLGSYSSLTVVSESFYEEASVTLPTREVGILNSLNLSNREVVSSISNIHIISGTVSDLAERRTKVISLRILSVVGNYSKRSILNGGTAVTL